MIPNKFPNKVGSEVIGRGGYNHAYALFGEETPERWMEMYGDKNVPYEKVRDDISTARRPFPEKATGVESVNARPKYVPNYIKGAVKPEMLGVGPVGLAAMLGGYSGAAGEGSTVRGEAEKFMGGRGAVNPPNVDPNPQTPTDAIGRFFQRLMGDKTPYNHFGLENRIDPTRTSKQYKIQNGR